jgi:hypothetical protein
MSDSLLDIDISQLTSRAVKLAQGILKIKPLQTKSIKNSNNGGVEGIIEWIWNGAQNLYGFISEGVKGFISGLATIQNAWSQIVSLKNFIWNFNWSQTDEELENNIKAQWNQLFTQIGGGLGQFAGWVTCGFIPSAATYFLNPELAAYLLAEVSEEFIDEVVGTWKNIATTAVQIIGRQIITWGFINLRKLIRNNASWIAKFLNLPAFSDLAIKQWGSKGSKPWSFAIEMEERIESLPDWLQAPAEEFLEEMDEACIEAGFVVASAADRFFAKQLLDEKKMPPNGEVKYLEITPNRQVEDEKIILVGQQELIKPIIPQVLAFDQIIRDKDLGIVYSAPANIPEKSFRPEIVLKFYQLKSDTTGQRPVDMEKRFRLMNETKKTLTVEKLKTIAEKIYQKFASPPFRFEKGNDPYTYNDPELGYHFLIWAKDGSEARRLCDQLLEIQTHSFENEYFRKGSVPADTGEYSQVPEKETILGEVKELPIKGKPGIVTFRFAYANLGHNIIVNLVDLTGRKKEVLYRGSTT